MIEHVRTPAERDTRHIRREWLHVLLAGLGLFVVTTIVMFVTGNPNLYPTVILLGNFLVPVVFVLYLYDHQRLSSLAPEMLARSFLIGGVLGVLGASVLEPLLIPQLPAPNQGLTMGSAMLVGLIEEGCKIAAVMWVARRLRHDSAMDGLLLGAAVGMGFAALESTGFAFTAFVASQGAVTASIAVTVLRGVIAPFGHGVWTGILGAVLFRQSEPHRFRISGAVILTYLFVSLLHGLWDGLPRTIFLVVPPGIPISVPSLVLSLIDLGVLAALYRQAERQRIGPGTTASRA
jgi:RsiW-degrading membrane proteinase PrsW (M82 family)